MYYHRIRCLVKIVEAIDKCLFVYSVFAVKSHEPDIATETPRIKIVYCAHVEVAGDLLTIYPRGELAMPPAAVYPLGRSNIRLCTVLSVNKMYPKFLAPRGPRRD